MKPMRKLIRQLSGPTGPYTIKAKVIKKTRVHFAEQERPLLYEEITFQDEEGTKMKTILSHEALEVFDDVFQDGMEYAISNAKVKRQTHALSASPSYKIEFNINTIIQESPDEPKYQSIASITRTLLLDNRYDVLGIVIYIDHCRKIPNHIGYPMEPRDVIVIDNSHEQVLTITTWEKLAVQECETIQTAASSFPVIGFTDLRASFQRGFTLSTTQSTSIIFNPLGGTADAFRAWATDNRELLLTKKHQVSQVRNPPSERTITTIAHLLAKRVNNTLQEEHHWLQVRLERYKSENLQLYLGCSNCGTGSDIEDLGVPYTCTACMREEVISTPRMTITFGATDNTGYYTFTAFTENAERILEIKADTIYLMPPQERKAYIYHIIKKVRETTFYIQVAPVTSLSLTQVLRWVLRHVSHT